jgi:hypothetical protein
MTRQEGLLVDVSSTRPGPASDVERLDSFLRPGRNCWALRPPGPRSERPTMPRSERTLSPSSATSGATCRQHWRRTRSRRRRSPRVAGASASAGGSGGRVARESAVRSAVTAARPGRRRRVHRHAGHTTSPLHRAGAAIDRAGRRGAADTPTREQGPDALLQRVRVLGFLILSAVAADLLTLAATGPASRWLPEIVPSPCRATAAACALAEADDVVVLTYATWSTLEQPSATRWLPRLIAAGARLLRSVLLSGSPSGTSGSQSPCERLLGRIEG